MEGFPDLIRAIFMLAGFILAAGGVYIFAKKGDRFKGALMIICALVIWGNVAIMTL